MKQRGMNSFHINSNTKRKKEARSDERNALPQSSKRVQMCPVCGVPEIWKKKQKHEHP